ncbi:hypothetical protein ABZU25_20995 [Micromonospora sp. NPDC005215]|uniref:hypothetical protein n=1 Tax=Micromonospora sp. NPDC005215 TaxID=3157024 RepID=UPI0033AD266A
MVDEIRYFVAGLGRMTSNAHSLPIDVQLDVDGTLSDLSEVAYGWLEGLSARLLPNARQALTTLPARASKGPGEPGAMFGVLTVSRGGVTAPIKTTERNCSASGFAWLRRELADLPAMATLQIGTVDEMGHRGRRHLVLSLRHHPVSPGWLRLSMLESDRRLDGSTDSMAVQRMWLAALRSCAQKWNPGFGHISYSYGTGATALEDCLPPQHCPPQQREPEHTVNDCRRLLRGYSWLTIVPAELAGKLGGSNALAASAAFSRVDELGDGALWLQATERFEEYHGDAVAKVFDALAPALRPGLPVQRLRAAGQPPHLLVFEDAADRAGVAGLVPPARQATQTDRTLIK